MSADDQDNIKKSEREKFLEEIRRKAEEAELKRLEQEEILPDDDFPSVAAPPVVPSEPVAPVPPPLPPAPVPFPSSDQSSLPPKAVREQKILVLRERISIALDRGRVDKAAELLEELSELIPGNPDLELLRERLNAVREEAEQREKRRPVSSVRPVDSSAVRERRSADKKKVIELLEAASNDYQQEKYDRALAQLDQLKVLDADNDEARTLRGQIEKAQRIAELIKREEARTKAERESMKGPEPEPVPVFEKGSDPWGSSAAPAQQDMGLELPPEEKGPVGPPKPPVMNRIATRVSRVRIPVKPILVIIVIAVAAVLAYVVIDNIRNAVIPPSYSVLVFPGTPISGDSSVTWTADGLTDDIIRDLAGVSEVRVLGPGTTFAFKGTQRDIVKAARALGANFAFQLGVVRTGEKVALQPAFYDTLQGKSIWTAHLETTMRELPGARQDMARRLLALMQVKASPEEDAVIRRLTTSVPECYDLYLRGRSMLVQPNQIPVEDVIRVFQQSVRADSFFSDAQSALGWAYILAYEADHDASPRYLDEARVRVQRASSLAPRNAEAFRVWGVVEYYRAQTGKAVERLEQAVAMAPSDAETQRRLALARLSMGNAGGALKAATQAMADDPGDLDSYIVLGQVYQFTDDMASALRTYEAGLRLAQDKSEYSSAALADILVFIQQPDRAISILLDRVAHVRDSYVDYYKLGRVQQTAGKPKAEWTASLDRAKALLDEELKRVPNDADGLSWKALVHTRLGEFRDANAAMKRALEIGPEDPGVLYNCARMYALQRDKGKAYEQLGRAVGRRYELARIMDLDFYNLRREEEFLRIVTR